MPTRQKTPLEEANLERTRRDRAELARREARKEATVRARIERARDNEHWISRPMDSARREKYLERIGAGPKRDRPRWQLGASDIQRHPSGAPPRSYGEKGEFYWEADPLWEDLEEEVYVPPVARQASDPPVSLSVKDALGELFLPGKKGEFYENLLASYRTNKGALSPEDMKSVRSLRRKGTGMLYGKRGPTDEELANLRRNLAAEVQRTEPDFFATEEQLAAAEAIQLADARAARQRDRIINELALTEQFGSPEDISRDIQELEALRTME
jgi:hypothetical protein